MDNLDIVIVSWNNKNSLIRTIESALKNSILYNEILVHLNCDDGSKDYLEERGIKYTISEKNEGLCHGANSAAALGKNKWVCLVDDDMYLFPDWDIKLTEFYHKHFTDEIVWLSSTMIERRGSGTGIGNIPWTSEEEMLATYADYIGKVPSVVTTQATPVMVQREAWEQVGGYPIEFSPAIGSDDAICKKLYDIGCRNFMNVPDSIIYHFQGNSTSRAGGNGAGNRDTQFRKLFNTTPREFMNLIGRGTKWERK